jgi:hypothetical protein
MFPMDYLEYFVTGDGLLAELPIDHLSGTVVGVGAEGQMDDATGRWNFSFEESDVPLVDALLFKGLLQHFVCLGIFGSKEHSRSGLIKAMCQHEGQSAVGIALFEPLFDIGKRSVLGGYAQHAGGFAYDNEAFVFAQKGRFH